MVLMLSLAQALKRWSVASDQLFLLIFGAL